jgi:hypothetical protein
MVVRLVVTSTNPPFCLFRELRKRPHIEWWDNFNKNIAVQMQGADSGAYKALNWTGKAIHVWTPSNPAKPISMKIDNAAENVWSAMGDNLLESKHMSVVRQWVQQVDSMGSDMYDMSLCVQYDVCRVPLKPDPEKALAFGHKKLAKVLAEHRDGMQDFYPLQIEDVNIGSWKGLLKLLKNWTDDRADDEHYSILNTDCNIFLRIMKVHVCVCGLVIVVMSSYTWCRTETLILTD